MTAELTIGVILFLGGLFVVLGLWQRRIARVSATRTIEEIRSSQERGTAAAIAQHPQIEVLTCIGCGSCVRACPEDGVLGLVDGIARIIHGSRCIGHARCADACPVGAITVGLGDVAKRSDVPVLSDGLETSVPGVFIAGELGGIALIKNAVEQGTRAVENVAANLRGRSSPPLDCDALDVLVVGSGPAGIAATLKAVECGLRCRTIEQDDLGGTVRKYPRRKLTMTQPVTLPLHGRMRKHEYVKEELIELWEGIVHKHGLDIVARTRLLGVERCPDGLLLAHTSAGDVTSRSVVLALGRRGTPRRLEVPGEEAEKVLYQLVDAATYVDRKVLVVGGGDSAIEAATALADQRGNEVTLSYRKEGFFRLKARNDKRIREYVRSGRVRVVFSSSVERIGERDVVLLGANGKAARVANDFVFVFAGGELPFPLLRSIGIRFGADEPAATKSRG